MNNYIGLSIREIKMKKSTSLFIFFAFLISAFMLISIIFSIPVVQELSREQFKKTQGDWHIRLETKKDIKDAYAKENFESIGYSCRFGESPIQNTGLLLSLEYYDETARQMWSNSFRLLDGKYPEKPGEIALEKRDFEILGISEELGNTVTLSVMTKNGQIENRKYKVCGIMDTCQKMALLGGHLGFLSEAEARGKGTEKNYYIRLYNPQKLENKEYADSLIKRYQAKTWNYNNYVLQAYSIFPAGEGKREYYTAWIPLLLVGVLVLFAAGLVVYNVLKIFLLKKMSQYGTLRAIGADTRQIYNILFLYIFILMSAAFPPGMVFGIFGAGAAAAIVAGNWSEILLENPNEMGLTDIIKDNTVFSWQAVITAIIVLICFGALAAVPVIRSITKQSPMKAMQGYFNNIKEIKKRNPKKIKNINRYLAKINIGRNRGRSIITVLSMIISISCMAGVTSYFKLRDIQNQYNMNLQGDYALTAPIGMARDMLPEEAAAALKNSGYRLEEIQRLEEKCEDCMVIPQVYFTLPYGFGGATEKFPEQAGKISIFGLNNKGIEYYAPDLPEKAAKKLEDGEGVLYYRYGAQNNMEERKWEEYVNYAMENDSITIAGRQYQILYDLNYEPNARVLINLNSPYGCTHLFLPEDVFLKVLGLNKPYYSQVSIIMGKNANKEKVTEAVEQFRNTYPGSGFQDFYKRRQELEKERKNIEYMGYLLAVLVAIVGVFNIISTSHENLYTRIKEIGTFRAIGMDKKNLAKSFLWEGFYYGFYSALAGFITGTFISWFFAASFLGKDWLHPEVVASVPWTMIAVTCITTVFICVMSIWIPLRKIRGIDIVECLKFVE